MKEIKQQLKSNGINVSFVNLQTGWVGVHCLTYHISTLIDYFTKSGIRTLTKEKYRLKLKKNTKFELLIKI